MWVKPGLAEELTWLKTASASPARRSGKVDSNLAEIKGCTVQTRYFHHLAFLQT